jgi:hypothetical protein
MIGDRDCMIAAIAQCHGLTVVTANLHEFRRVPGLSVEDWREDAREFGAVVRSTTLNRQQPPASAPAMAATVSASSPSDTSR